MMMMRRFPTIYFIAFILLWCQLQVVQTFQMLGWQKGGMMKDRSFKMMQNEEKQHPPTTEHEETTRQSPPQSTGTTAPFNNVIKPSYGSRKSGLEKFLMMYTCKMCEHRNAQMISKIAYRKGMVIATCVSCRQMHLIADNQERMDMPEMPRRIEHYLENLGERVQKLQISESDLDRYLIVERDGEIFFYPKAVGPPPQDVTIIDVPKRTQGN